MQQEVSDDVNIPKDTDIKDNTKYTFTIIPEFTFTTDLDSEEVRMTLRVTTIDGKEHDGKYYQREPEQGEISAAVPMNYFGSETRYEDWVSHLLSAYHLTLASALSDEAFAHFYLMANALLNEYGILPPDVLKEHIDTLAERKTRDIKKALGISSRPPAFTDTEAYEAIDRLGGRPSRNALAKELNTTPATVLNWARRRGHGSLESLLDEFASWRGVNNSEGVN